VAQGVKTAFDLAVFRDDPKTLLSCAGGIATNPSRASDTNDTNSTTGEIALIQGDRSVAALEGRTVMKRLVTLAAFGIPTAVGIATAASSTEQGFRD
jgi:hypothetical protein